jgi:chemotaxis protein histidine kinase CheA
MAQKLGGEIAVSSELNRGTTFDVKLGATPANGELVRK